MPQLSSDVFLLVCTASGSDHGQGFTPTADGLPDPYRSAPCCRSGTEIRGRILRPFVAFLTQPWVRHAAIRPGRGGW